MANLRQKKEDFVKKYIINRCHVAKTCNEMQMSRITYHYWRKKDPEFNSAIEEADEALNDWVESKLKEKIDAGEWTAIRYWLENKARHRGWKPLDTAITQFNNSNLALAHSGTVQVEISKTLLTADQKIELPIKTIVEKPTATTPKKNYDSMKTTNIRTDLLHAAETTPIDEIIGL